MLNIKPMFYRVFFIAFIIAAPIDALFAQSITVADLIPHKLGCYVDYNEYDTASTGSAGVKSHASYTINAIDVATNVISVLDSIGGGDPSGIHELNYFFTSAGDLQVYADTALINYMIPASIAAGITQSPDKWVDYFKLSTGTTAYPIMVLTSKVTYSGQSLTVTNTITGQFVKVEPLFVGNATYDSAYLFEITAVSKVSDGAIELGGFTSTQSNWLVRGIGVVKTVKPIAGTTIVGNSVTTEGRETDMTSFGIASTSSVTPIRAQGSPINAYPDPASDQVTLTFDRPVNQIFLYDYAGKMIRSFNLSSKTSEALLWVGDIPNGAYHARAVFADGSSRSSELVIRH